MLGNISSFFEMSNRFASYLQHEYITECNYIIAIDLF